MGGILQHRSYIDLFVDECLDESRLRLCNLDGVAVTTRPGLVISLRVGAEKAVSLARYILMFTDFS